MKGVGVILDPPFQILSVFGEEKWENGKLTSENGERFIKGKVLPLKAWELSQLNGGTLSADTRKFYTKGNIKDGEEAIYKGKRYKLTSFKDYPEEADIKILLMEYIEDES
ncbi:hypothetical protein [Fusobacterium ulcerans]|uniref:hypothetical protein n=1 Tax=Fusobacterium ulcerans TaxID=861 RepID=UPI00309CFE04